MQQTTGVAVLATHLAQTDRRALSQAWYSALHLAAGAPRSRAPVAPAARSAPPAARSAGSPGEARGARAGASTVTCRSSERRGAHAASRVAASAARDALARPERRGAKSELARTIERGIVRRAPGAETASFVVRAANGRVHLVVRTGGGATRVVAVCAPPLRERVERALAQARFALAGHGLRAEAA